MIYKTEKIFHSIFGLFDVDILILNFTQLKSLFLMFFYTFEILYQIFIQISIYSYALLSFKKCISIT